MVEYIKKYKIEIARKVRALRQSRRWTQKELATRLDLSQSRLSEIERGKGSFTAEQFLVILQLFNVGATHFAPTTSDPTVELQNALARLGAEHLRETEQIVPDGSDSDVTEVVRRALVSGSLRLVTALAPVLVKNIDHVNLKGLNLQLVAAGMPQRLPWLVENVLEAIQTELEAQQPKRWKRLLRRAQLVLESFLEPLEAPPAGATQPALDILDTEIRSKRTLEQVKGASSQSSQRRGVVTRLVPEDFVHALNGGRADD